MNPLYPINSLPLERFGLFSHLSETQLSLINGMSLLKHYNTGEIVFYEGDDSRYFHLLVEGEVTVFKSTASNETLLIHRFRAPSFIAEAATLKQIPYPASCESITPGIILKIPRDPFLELLQNDPSISLSLIASLMEKIATLERSIQRQSAPNALSKVARLIREDTHSFHRQKGIDTARMLGITPETLSRMLKKLKKEGIITISKTEGVKILQPEILNTYCG